MGVPDTGVAEVPDGALQGDALQWRLLEVDRPGSLHIYTTGSTARPTVVFDSDDGLPDAVAPTTPASAWPPP